MSAFISLMDAATSNAAMASTSIHQLDVFDTDNKSRFLKSYKARTPPPGIAPAPKADSRPVPKNMLIPPKPKKEKEGPSSDQIKAYMEKQLRQKARLLSKKFEERKQQKEKLLEARVKANDGKLTKKIVKQFSLSHREAREKLSAVATGYNYFDHRDPEEEARLALRKIRHGEEVESEVERVRSRPSHSHSSSSSSSKRRPEDDSFDRRYEEERRQRIKEQERCGLREEQKKREEERRREEERKRRKERAPSPIEIVEPDFSELMRLASLNKEKVAATGYTRSPSPPPSPTHTPTPSTKSVAGPASFKRKLVSQSLIYDRRKGSVFQAVAEKEAKLEQYNRELEAMRASLDKGLSLPLKSSSNNPRPSKDTEKRRPEPGSFKPSSSQPSKHRDSPGPLSSKLSSKPTDSPGPLSSKHNHRDSSKHREHSASKNASVASSSHHGKPSDSSSRPSGSSLHRHSPGPLSSKFPKASQSATVAGVQKHGHSPGPLSSKFKSSSAPRHRDSPGPLSSKTPAPGPLSSKPQTSSRTAPGPLSSKHSSDHRRPEAKTPAPPASKYSTPGPASSKKPPPSAPRPGPASSKSNGASGHSSSGSSSSKPTSASGVKPSKPSGIGQLSEAQRERLARMNGSRPPPPRPNLSQHRPSHSKDSPKPAQSKPTTSSGVRQSMTSLKRPNDRAMAPEPTYGKVARRPSPPPSHVVRSKYSYSNVAGGSGPSSSYLDDEEEEDSELDDFIDDTPMNDGFGTKEIAKTIKAWTSLKTTETAVKSEVFRYDKRRYANEKWSSADDRAMTASFKDIQKEEKASARAGAMEDYQEFLREKGKKAKK